MKTLHIIIGLAVMLIGAVMLYNYFQPWTPPFYSGIAFVLVGLNILVPAFKK